MQKKYQYKSRDFISISDKSEIKTKVNIKMPWYNRYSAFELMLLASALFQVVMGSVVIALSMLGLIRPIIIAAFMSLFGSVVTLLGAFICYEIIKGRRCVDKMSRDAVQRVIRDQN